MSEYKVTGGIGLFFYSLIPSCLIFALLLGFGFYTGVIEWHHRQVQEGRRDSRVGADANLRAPVELLFNGRGCIEVTRAFLDGTEITAYLHNKCPKRVADISYSVRELSPDGTTVDSAIHYLDGSMDLEADERREQQVKVSDDKRVTKIIFAIHDFLDF